MLKRAYPRISRQNSSNPGRSNYYIYVYNPDTVQGVKLNGSPVSQVSSFSSPAPCWLMTADGKLGIKLTDALAVSRPHFRSLRGSSWRRRLRKSKALFSAWMPM